MKQIIKKIMYAGIILGGIAANSVVIAGDAQTAERVVQIVNLVPDPDISCQLSTEKFGTPYYLVHQKLNHDATLSEFSIPPEQFLSITNSGVTLSIETDTNVSSLYGGIGEATDLIVSSAVKLCAAAYNTNILGHIEVR